MAPQFATEEYWDDFFTKKNEAYDWLLEASQVRNIISEVLHQCPPNPQLLHIGCGNSDLSWQLRGLVDSANQVHNVDYSEVAVEAAIKADLERTTQTSGDEDGCMRWSRVDLLSLNSIRALIESREVQDSNCFDLVVDKGTTDSIALGEDIELSLPYVLSTVYGPSSDDDINLTTTSMHPVDLLAVHLAAITRRGTGRWIAVSFSEDRFPFLPLRPACSESDDKRPENSNQGSLPDPASLWKLEKKWSVPAPQETELTEEAAYKPAMLRWIYVLTRTDQAVYIRTPDKDA